MEGPICTGPYAVESFKHTEYCDVVKNEYYWGGEVPLDKLTMNKNGFLKDKVLRQAIIRALDKETYSNVLLEGGASAGKAPVPPTLDFGFDELNDENAYDVEGAKQLLEEAGYIDVNGDGFVEMPSGDKLELKFVIYTSREELNIYSL